jgi:predicted phage terminase large subunit-like protein
LGELGTKTIVVGTPLHLDSLLMRLKEGIRSGSRSGEYLEFPIVDEANGNRILWPGLYPDLNAIETKKLEIGNETAFQREYMLKVLPGDDQLVSRESIQYYDEFPTEGFRGNLIAIDLAYSDSGTAHYTAMVALAAYGYGQNLRFYVYPNPINERISDPTVLIERIKNFSYAIGGNKYCNVLVEENLAHAFLVSQLQNSGITVTTVRPVGDKRNRFIGPAQAIQIGKVFFPRQGCEELINQLVYFPLEKYDDLLDAFSHGVNELNSKYNRPQPNIRVFESPIRGFRQI